MLNDVTVYGDLKLQGEEEWKKDLPANTQIKIKEQTLEPDPGSVATFGPGIVIGFGGKDKTKVKRDENAKTEVYRQTISSEEVKKQLMELYHISEEVYLKKLEWTVDPGAFNVVAVCISDLLLGTVDLHDCILATYGDPEVPEECRRGVFGLFQDVKAVYPAEIQAVAKRFAHLKATVHAVLFLFKPSGSGVLDFSLQQVLVWNRALTTEAGARPLNDHLCAAITPLK